MTNEDYSKVPPPHLLKKFSEQAREDSQKRGRPGYCKTFAKLCIDWALNSKSSPNNLQIRSSDIVPPPDLIRQWMEKTEYDEDTWFYESYIAEQAAQWGADQELEACCEWLEQNQGRWEIPMALRAARRPKSATLKKQSLKHLDVMERDGHYLPEILQDLRRALEALPE
jgi:hypothetical protein